jgi:glutathione synthase/RimK-type ligase-like ATP-grasp enzyme
MTQVGMISQAAVPDGHLDFVRKAATEYLTRRRQMRPKRRRPRHDLAVLADPSEEHPPSNERGIRRFADAAAAVGIATELIDRSDYGRLGEFDALFIRETTSVDHHTYRFSRRAANLGLVVIDDPTSIVRCTNKVYLAELLARAKIPAPRTLIVHEKNIGEVAENLGLPCVLKRPDGAFSQGVMKAAAPADLRAIIEAMLEDSDLVIAQEWMPTEYDWRIGVLDGQPLYACRYHMAQHHWQIAAHGDPGGGTRYGKVEAVAVDAAPAEVVAVAVRAARLIGLGLYGVDLKEVGGRPCVIEINDNPTLDAGMEDGILGRQLWERLAKTFLERIERGLETRSP